MRGWHLSALAVVAVLGGCGADTTGEGSSAANENEGASAGEVVTPPFAVRGNAEGLLLTWFDAEGTHTAQARNEIPEARRGEVRVDSLELAPEARDPEHVFVADLSAPGDDGSYVVRRLSREDFDRRVETFGDTPAGETALASSDVIVFGASWCGACRETEAYLRERGVPFVERDIEREPGAREDMQQRAARAGISPRGIPVTDFRGRIIQGFDRGALDRAIRETTPAAAGGAPAGGGITI